MARTICTETMTVELLLVRQTERFLVGEKFVHESPKELWFSKTPTKDYVAVAAISTRIGDRATIEANLLIEVTAKRSYLRRRGLVT